ncbi:hypothetical protein [Jonesia quinghaiensis]|uniref:hypothetical protein n=1 Tax=Jonesia quinghaiensis TaxID=262806 RepID=UPI00041D9459|nr:hypothetical protein [Jonesia quinghaiensis]
MTNPFAQQKSPLPTAQATKEMVETLIGRQLNIRTGAPMVDPEGPGGALVAEYVSDTLSLNALVAMDLGAAANIGASLALMPAAVAQDAMKDGELTDILFETVGEVFNVMAALFNQQGAPHLRLGTVHPAQQPLPGDIAPWVMAYVPRLDLEVEVTGYGSGHLSVVVL